MAVHTDRQVRRVTALIQREGDGYVALCPELDVASQGNSVEEARLNLQEALELFFECASTSEIQERWRGEVYLTALEVSIGWQAGLPRALFEERG